MLVSAFFFAASGPFAKAMYATGWTPGSVVLLRLAGTAAVLIIPTLVGLRGRWHEVFRAWPTVISYGVVSMAGVQLFYFLAVASLPVAVAILLEMSAPLLIVFWLWATTRIRPATVTFIGMAVSVVGLILVLDPGGEENLSLMGVVFALAAAVCLASYFIVSAKANVNIPPVPLTGLGMIIGTATVTLLLVVGIVPSGFSAAPVPLGVGSYSWMWPIAIIVFCTVGAYVFGILGLRLVGATVGSFVNLTEVPFSALVAWVIVGELLTVIQLYGGFAIVGGIVFIKWGEVRVTRRLQRREVLMSDLADSEPG